LADLGATFFDKLLKQIQSQLPINRFNKCKQSSLKIAPEELEKLYSFTYNPAKQMSHHQNVNQESGLRYERNHIDYNKRDANTNSIMNNYFEDDVRKAEQPIDFMMYSNLNLTNADSQILTQNKSSPFFISHNGEKFFKGGIDVLRNKNFKSYEKKKGNKMGESKKTGENGKNHVIGNKFSTSKENSQIFTECDDEHTSNNYESFDANSAEYRNNNTINYLNGNAFKKEVKNRQGRKAIPACDRPYICDYPGCISAFKRLEHLKRHSKVHSGERKYKCTFPGCYKRFARSDNLGQHKKLHRANSNSNYSKYGMVESEYDEYDMYGL